MNNISWRAIRAFLHVAEQGSFTSAADTSGMSKANLSQQVSELEAVLGVQLLHRTTRRLRLTEIGEGYYHQCSHAMQQLDDAAEWATQSTQELKGSIRMNSVGGPIGEDILAPLLIEFQTQNPQVQIALDFSSPKVDLIEKQYDLVLRMGELPDSSLIAKKLHTITTRYVASPDFIAKHGPIEKPEDLTHLPLIYGSVNHWILTRGEEKRVVPVQKGMKIINGRVMRKAALAGLGVTRNADIYVARDIKQGKLQEILPDWSETTPLSLVCPPRRHQLRRVRSLMDWLQKEFKPAYQKAL